MKGLYLLVYLSYTFVNCLLKMSFNNCTSLKGYKDKGVVILIQNPPCIPALLAAFIANIIIKTFLIPLLVFKLLINMLFNNSREPIQLYRPVYLVIDWHNLGFSMFDNSNSVEEKEKRFFTKLMKLIEFYLARQLASGHLCVSIAMKNYIRSELNNRTTIIKNVDREQCDSNITVLYDRPARIFADVNYHRKSHSTRIDPLFERHQLLKKLGYTNYNLFGAPKSKSNEETIQTISVDRKIEFVKEDKTAFLISSTSWTPDEDFNILIDALVAIEEYLTVIVGSKSKGNFFSRVLCVVTGKGTDFQEI